MSTHTPEPWTISNDGRGPFLKAPAHSNFPHGQVVATVSSGPGKNTQSNAERIVACVNACEGINPDAVPELLKAAENALQGMDGGTDDASCHLGICTRERCGQCQRVDGLRAAIAKAEEE